MHTTDTTAPAAPEAEDFASPSEQAAETLAQTQAEPSPADPDDAADDATDAPPRGRDKRIDQLTRRFRDAERERDMLRMELERFRAASPQPAPAAEPAQPKPLVPPDPNAYPLGVVDEAYHRDMRHYIDAAAEQRARDVVMSTLRGLHAQQQKMMHETIRQSLDEQYRQRAAAIADDPGDLAEAENRIFQTFAGTPLAEPVAAAIMESEFGPLIARHIGSNPDELRRLRTMSASSVVRHIGRLEERFEAERKAAKTTNAPPPPQTVRGTTATMRDPMALSQEDFERRLQSMLRR